MAPAGKKRRASMRRVPRPFRGPGGDGFTLVEMILVIILVGIVFGFGSVLLGKVFSSYSFRRDVADADWQAKLALERVARELRAVRSAATADLDPASAAQVRFVDSDGNGVCFYRDPPANRLMRSAQAPVAGLPGDPCSGGQSLADNITALSFSYWTRGGAMTTVAASVYYITLDITVTEGVYSAGFRTNVRPRNF